jgi:hypothetical protein
MKRAALLALASMFALSSPGEAEPDVGSGNYMLQHCQHYIANDRFDVWDGECGGTIGTLLFLGNALPEGFKVCRPKGASKQQAARVIVNYMQSNPATLHEPFQILAMTALSRAWPCKS